MLLKLPDGKEVTLRVHENSEGAYLELNSILVSQFGMPAGSGKAYREQLDQFFSTYSSQVDAWIVNYNRLKQEWEFNPEEFIEIDVVRSHIQKVLIDGELPVRRKYEEIQVAAYKHLKANGQFYYDKNTQESYWFDGKSKELMHLSRDQFKARLSSMFRLNPEDTAFKWLNTGIRYRIIEFGKRISPRKFSFYDRSSFVLYFNHRPGRLLKVTEDSAKEIDNGEGELFLWDEKWEPIEWSNELFNGWGKLNDLVLTKLSLDDNETDLLPSEACLVVEKTIMCLLFRSVIPHRPILAPVGVFNSGKTTYLERIGKMLFGREFAVLNLEDQKQDGAIAYVTTKVYSVFDNADERMLWLPDLLARVSTGASVGRRILYKTNELAEFPIDTLLGITARMTPWARPDVISRLLIFPTKKAGVLFNESKDTELVLSQRRYLIGELMFKASRCIMLMKSSSDEPIPSINIRLTAFYEFCVSTSEDKSQVINAFRKMAWMQRSFSASQEESLIEVLRKWIEVAPKQRDVVTTDTIWTAEMKASELYSQLLHLSRDAGNEIRLGNPNRLSMRLKEIIEALRASEIEARWRHSKQGGMWKFRFVTTVTDSEKQPEVLATLSSADSQKTGLTQKEANQTPDSPNNGVGEVTTELGESSPVTQREKRMVTSDDTVTTESNESSPPVSPNQANQAPNSPNNDNQKMVTTVTTDHHPPLDTDSKSREIPGLEDRNRLKDANMSLVEMTEGWRIVCRVPFCDFEIPFTHKALEAVEKHSSEHPERRG